MEFQGEMKLLSKSTGKQNCVENTRPNNATHSWSFAKINIFYREIQTTKTAF